MLDSIFHWDFLTAWLWNPLALIALCGIVVFDIYAAIVLVVRTPRLRLNGLTLSQKNGIRIAVVVLIAVNWIYLLAHHTRY